MNIVSMGEQMKLKIIVTIVSSLLIVNFSPKAFAGGNSAMSQV